MYFLYLLAAGFGIPVSEDALVVWVGAKLALNQFQSFTQVATVLAMVYAGVVLSDMITYFIGVLMTRGILSKFFPNWATSATASKAKRQVERWGSRIGMMQRFFLGFRGPLCLCAGAVGAKPLPFFLGSATGALFTMSIQIFVGHLLKNTPNAYLAALGLVAVPNLIGNILGPMVVTLSGIILKYKKKGSPASS